MISIEYGLPVIALIVSIVVFVLITKRERRFRKMIENDKEFMEWRKKHRKNKELKKQISKLEHEIFKYRKKIEFLSPRVKTGLFNIKRKEVISINRINEIEEYHEKIIQIERKITCLKGAITNE